MSKFLIPSIAFFALHGTSQAETLREQYLETGEACAKVQEARVCMESYGFQCHQSRRPHKSIVAQTLGCNLDLGDGRKHFVQMLYDNGKWSVETERTYWPDYSEARTPEEDPDLALSSYIQREMDDYSVHSSGGIPNSFDLPDAFTTGARRNDGLIAVRAM